jgi:hypothetical protein
MSESTNSGRYANSHVLFADGAQVSDPKRTRRRPGIRDHEFAAYARKIEGTEHSGGKRPPQSRQAPNGVYNVVADMLNKRYGNVARIRFSYRTASGGSIWAARRQQVVRTQSLHCRDAALMASGRVYQAIRDYLDSSWSATPVRL